MTRHAPDPRDVIAKVLANDIAGWRDDPLCSNPECWVCDEGRRVADRVIAALEEARYGICLLGRKDAPKVRDIL